MRLKAVALFRNGNFFDKMMFLAHAAERTIEWTLSCAIEASLTINNGENQS